MGMVVRLVSVICILVVASVSLQGVADSEPDEPIGTYEADGNQHDLSESHVKHGRGQLTIRGPGGTSKLSVSEAFLNPWFGDLASTAPFEKQNGKIRARASEITFVPFHVSDSPLFSFGSMKSIRMADRPMWISVHRLGEDLRIEMDDGDATGQRVFLNKEWLLRERIHAPIVHHENGEELPVQETTDGQSFYFDMPHFSSVLVSSVVDARSRVGPVWIAPHDGDIWYDFASARATVDIPQRLVTSELWIEQGWVDANIPNATPVSEQWTIDTIDATPFYVVSLLASQTPGTLVIETTNPWIVPCRVEMGLNCTPVMEDLITDICLQTTCDVANITLLFDEMENFCVRSGCTLGPGDALPNLAVRVGSQLGTEWGLCQLLLSSTQCSNVERTVNDQGYHLADLAMTGLQLATAGRQAGGEADDGANPIETSGSQTLRTEGGSGLWSLSMVPEGLPVIPGTDIVASQILSFVPTFGDVGKAYQPTEYWGDNPPPGEPWENTPPAYELNDEFWCKAGLLAAGVGLAFAETGLGLAVAAVGGLVAIGACFSTASAGSWAAIGNYHVVHGSGGSGWEGELLNLPGVISLTTSVTLDQPLSVSTPYGILVCPCEGYYEQQQTYQTEDWSEREAAWKAHNVFREQLNAPADAEIVLNLEVLTNSGTNSQDAENFYVLGDTPVGRLLLNIHLDQLVVECAIPCGSENVLTISSGGSGSLKPGDQETVVEFVGTPGDAVISILGVQIQGLTLDGSHSGDAYIPANLPWLNW